MIIFLAFAFGCTLTYLITIISSTIKSSQVLEDAMLTYALLMMSAFEVSIQQIENSIVANRIEQREADRLRKIHSNEFKIFANKKIKDVTKLVPPSHENILRYKNFDEMKIYITQQFRRKNEEFKQKRKKD